MLESAIQGLTPEILWQRFYEISQIPRPSKKEGKIRDYLRKLIKDMNLTFREDKVGNIVVKVPATKEYEGVPVVVLQGHIDMVGEKNKNIIHDFENDPLKLKKEDGWITADGTTLGSDNGIGIAAALSIITDKNVIHGPLEILFTIDEETGLTGANSLKPGFITGKILLNMDSEEDGAFYVGCAGGIDTVGTFNLEKELVPNNTSAYNLVVSGLKGGHSGLDINLGRGNAIKILTRVLKSLEGLEFYVSKLEGGSKRNAIPREAEALLYISSSEVNKANNLIKELESRIRNELKSSDEKISITFQKSDESSNFVFDTDFSNRIIDTLLALPSGVISMSQDIPDLIETSTNLATITTGEDSIIIGTSQRSSIESAKQYIAQSVLAIFSLADANIEIGNEYPGWKPDMNSQILKTSINVYKNLFNKEPEIKAIHAGLECGILGNKNPGLDMVSFGPTIQGAHSPDEKVNIETVIHFYELLKGILKTLATVNKG